MKQFFFISLFFTLTNCIFTQTILEQVSEIEIVADAELKALWSSIDDICHPLLEDYEKIQNHLRYGRREYLDILFEQGEKYDFNLTPIENEPYRAWAWRHRFLQRIDLIDPHSPSLPPSFEILHLNCSSESKTRCIVVYSSYNIDWLYREPYTKRIDCIVQELNTMNFSGHVLIRKGSYPLLENRGLCLAHIPYSFKVLSLIEAELLGYQDVLWIDTSIHPTGNLNVVFEEISNKGYYLLHNGTNIDYDYHLHLLPEPTIESWGITPSQLEEIPHIIAGIIGVSFKNNLTREFIREWYRLTANLYPALSFYPEEFLISLVCWKLNIRPSDHIGHQVDVKSVLPYNTKNPTKPFWFDKG